MIDKLLALPLPQTVAVAVVFTLVMAALYDVLKKGVLWAFPSLGRLTARGLRTWSAKERARDEALSKLIGVRASRHVALGIREQRTRSRANELLVVGTLLAWLSGVFNDMPRSQPQLFVMLLGVFLIVEGIKRRIRARREYNALSTAEEPFYKAHRLRAGETLPDEPDSAPKDMTMTTRPMGFNEGRQFLGD